MRTFTTKPTKWLKVTEQIRKHFDEATDRLLGESIRERQLQPVGSRPDGTLLWGGRRWHGATLVGLETLDVCITDESLTEFDIVSIQMTENGHQRPLTAFEQYQGIETLRQLRPEWTFKELAAHLRLRPDVVTKMASPCRCPESVRAALEAGKIGLGHCYVISQGETEADQLALFQDALSGTTRDELVRRLKERRRPTGSGRATSVRVPLPSGFTVSVSGSELSFDDLLKSLGDVQRAARRAREDRLDLKTWQSVMADRAKASS